MTSEDVQVGILLGTYNGDCFLHEQLESIAQQMHTAWRLVISDDGSTDETLGIAKAFRSRCQGKVAIVRGQGKGFAQNFLAMAANPPFEAEYWAFCDQDDIWEPDKLSRAVDALLNVPPGVPALYCSRTLLIDANGNGLGSSPLYTLTPSFKNALVQNIASGNTMVFNEAARLLLIEANDESIPFHDWLLYLVVTGCGGMVYYDPQPSLRYRQHGGNVVGYWGGIRGYLVRAGIMFSGEFRSWIDGNLKGVSHISAKLTDSNRQLMEAFAELRFRGMFYRFAAIKRLGVVHQNPLAIFLAVLFNKL